MNYNYRDDGPDLRPLTDESLIGAIEALAETVQDVNSRTNRSAPGSVLRAFDTIVGAAKGVVDAYEALPQGRRRG